MHSIATEVSQNETVYLKVEGCTKVTRWSYRTQLIQSFGWP